VCKNVMCRKLSVYIEMLWVVDRPWSVERSELVAEISVMGIPIKREQDTERPSEVKLLGIRRKRLLPTYYCTVRREGKEP